MQTTRNGRDFYNLTALGDDQCEDTSRELGNRQISNYYLDRVPLSVNAAYTDTGIYPSVSDKKFSHDNLPIPGDTSKASKLAYSRPIVTMPFMGAGQTSIINPDLDSALTRGSIITNKRSYNPVPLKSNTYRPMPMIEGIRKEIQNPVHIIPTYWQRGGIDTRGQIRSVSYSKENCTQAYGI